MAAVSTNVYVLFIDLYESEPAIWDPNNPLNKDKKKVNDAWNRIADNLQIPVLDLKKKKESLMATFRSHFKKKQDSIRSGMGKEEIYKPKWVFYDVMEKFLKTKYTCYSIISTDEESSLLSHAQDEAGIECQTDQETATPSDARNNTQTKDKNIKIPVQRRRAVKPPELDKLEKDISTAFNTLNALLQKKTEDDCDLYGRLLANKLRSYSEIERHEIMYDIDGLLLKRRRYSSPQDVSSPSQIIYSKRQSSPFDDPLV